MFEAQSLSKQEKGHAQDPRKEGASGLLLEGYMVASVLNAMSLYCRKLIQVEMSSRYLKYRSNSQ